MMRSKRSAWVHEVLDTENPMQLSVNHSTAARVSKPASVAIILGLTCLRAYGSSKIKANMVPAAPNERTFPVNLKAVAADLCAALLQSSIRQDYRNAKLPRSPLQACFSAYLFHGGRG